MSAISSRGKKHFDVGGAFVIVLVTVLAWQMLSRATANMLVASDQPGIALAVRPSDGAALSGLAAVAIARPPTHGTPAGEAKTANAKAANQLADAALTRTPLNPSALRLLAQAAEMTGDPGRTERLMKIAGQQTVRDTVTSLYLLNLYASRKNYAKALDNADALLRLTPSLGDNVFPLVDAIAVNPDGQPALIALLRQRPPWRGDFLASMASKLVRPEDFLDVIIALKDGPHPLDDAEFRAYLDPLISRGLFEQAYDAWLQLLPPGRLEHLRYVSNGGFDDPLTDLPFGWTIRPIDGATVSVEKIPGKDDRALFVQFEGRRVAFRNVTQLVMLPPGTYRLSGSYQADGLDNPRGMTWRLYCAERNDGKPIAETPRVSGTSDGWKDFETRFTVPESRCRAQSLRLELASRISIEENVAGSIWYDNIAISKAETVEPPSDAEPPTPLGARPGRTPGGR